MTDASDPTSDVVAQSTARPIGQASYLIPQEEFGADGDVARSIEESGIGKTLGGGEWWNVQRKERVDVVTQSTGQYRPRRLLTGVRHNYLGRKGRYHSESVTLMCPFVQTFVPQKKSLVPQAGSGISRFSIAFEVQRLGPVDADLDGGSYEPPVHMDPLHLYTVLQKTASSIHRRIDSETRHFIAGDR
ncbi:hypothetical protein CBL_08669 [Carabus blaptoides fortunei]